MLITVQTALAEIMVPVLMERRPMPAYVTQRMLEGTANMKVVSLFKLE